MILKILFSTAFLFQALHLPGLNIFSSGYLDKKDTTNPSYGHLRDTSATLDNFLHPGESVSDKIIGNLFIRAEASKINCYLGEPLVITYKLFSRLDSKSIIVKEPSFTGFSVTNLVDFVGLKQYVERHAGKLFQVKILRKVQLVPLVTGRLTLDGMEVDNTVHFIKKQSWPSDTAKKSNDIFSQLAEEETLPLLQASARISARPISIQVNALPEKEDSIGFSGAIGRFSIVAKIKAKKVIVNEPVVLTIEIKGKGNLAFVKPPGVKWPPYIDFFEPKVKTNISRTGVPMQEEKIFEYTFIPGKAGDYRIPPIEFSYFNPSTGVYQSVRSNDLHFEVIMQTQTGEVKDAKWSPSPRSLGTMSRGAHRQGTAQKGLPWMLIFLVIISAIMIVVKNVRKRKTAGTSKKATEQSNNKPVDCCRQSLLLEYLEKPTDSNSLFGSTVFYST